MDKTIEGLISVELTMTELTQLKNLVRTNISLLIAFEDNHTPDKFADLWTTHRVLMDKLNDALGVPHAGLPL